MAPKLLLSEPERVRACEPTREGRLSKRTYGILAGVIGSALGAWWYNRYRSRGSMPVRDHGTVIFDNTPTASDEAVF